MTKIKVYSKDNEYKRIIAEGHADYAEIGKDIVCASISILLYQILIYAEYNDIELEVIESKLGGLYDIEIKESEKDINSIICSICLALDNLVLEYSNNVSIEYIEL